MSANYVSSVTSSMATTFAIDTFFDKASKFNIDTSNISYNMQKILYYSDTIIGDNNQFDSTNYFRVGDICFATGDIIAYSSNVNGSNNINLNYYDIFKSTIIRSHTKYKLNTENDAYLITFANGQDTSSMLPSGSSTQFLNSPVFTPNNNSQSGGYFIANVEDIVLGDKPINYNNEYSPIQNTYNESILNLDDLEDIETAIQDFNDDYINATDTTNEILNRILMALYSIDDKIENIQPYVDNSVSNVTNRVNQYFQPDRIALNQQQQLLQDTFAQHLGFIYDIPSTLVFAIGVMQESTDFDNITITIPSVTIFDYNLIQEYTYSFTDLFEQNQVFNTIHEFILMASDVTLLCMLLALGKKCYEKVVESK